MIPLRNIQYIYDKKLFLDSSPVTLLADDARALDNGLDVSETSRHQEIAEGFFSEIRCIFSRRGRRRRRQRHVPVESKPETLAASLDLPTPHLLTSHSTPHHSPSQPCRRHPILTPNRNPTLAPDRHPALAPDSVTLRETNKRICRASRETGETQRKTTRTSPRLSIE